MLRIAVLCGTLVAKPDTRLAMSTWAGLFREPLHIDVAWTAVSNASSAKVFEGPASEYSILYPAGCTQSMLVSAMGSVLRAVANPAPRAMNASDLFVWVSDRVHPNTITELSKKWSPRTCSFGCKPQERCSNYDRFPAPDVCAPPKPVAVALLLLYMSLLCSILCATGCAMWRWVSNGSESQPYESCQQYDVEDTPLTLLHLAEGSHANSDGEDTGLTCLFLPDENK